MRRARVGAVLSVLLAGGCGGGGVPPVATGPDRAEVLVRVDALPRAGVKAPVRVEGYGRVNPEKGRRFARVDYRRMADIAVTLEGAGLAGGGPAPREARLVARTEGFDRDLVLLAPGGATDLRIENRRRDPVSLYAAGDRDGFDVAVPAGGEAAVTLRVPGVYAIGCLEDETLEATAVVAPSAYAQLASSGGWALFRDLPPGIYRVTVRAPRLPAWTGTVEAPPGGRAELAARVSVESLPDK